MMVRITMCFRNYKITLPNNCQPHFFIELYTKNMQRVNADENYFFKKKYFFNLLTNDCYEAELILCKHNDTNKIIAGAIFIKTGAIVQYHLSGLNEDYFSYNPIKLIIDEMRMQYTDEGYKYLNLGGGKGSIEDSLFRFKSSFSKNFKTFKIWKYIVNKNIIVAMQSILAILIQFFGYGYGFLKSSIYVAFLKRKPEQVFSYLFFNMPSLLEKFISLN